MARSLKTAAKQTKRKMPTGRRFQPGQSGNPGGRPKKKPITAIYEAMLDDGVTPKEIEKAMLALIKARDISALKEFANRVEGTVAELVEHTGVDGGPVEHTIRFGDGNRDNKS